VPGAAVRRPARTRAALACAALGLAAGPAAVAATPLTAAAAASGQVAVTITSISPDIATPGRPVTVSGTVSNTTHAAISGLSVQLRSAASVLTSRGDLANYAAGILPADSPVAGAVAQLPGALAAGAAENWTVALSAHQVGMTTFGVYPLAAELDAAGVPVNTDHTFLPFWPGRSAAALAGPLRISWVWPLIDSPHQAACSALLDDSLAASLTGGGRLAGLLAAGSTPAAADARLTWAIDPGLLASVSAMTRPYRVGGSAACGGSAARQPSNAARTWLTGLRSVTASQDFFVTPYDDVDVAALTHQGMDADLTHAVSDGRAAAQAILGSAQRPATAATDAGEGHVIAPDGIGGIAWPTAGTADYGVLGSLAVNGTGTVILDGTMMPPAAQQPFTPSAVTRTPDGVGAELHVALADDTITQILGSAPAHPAGQSAAAHAAVAGTAFGTEQRFLAETAMIAAEAPALPRSLVVTPPRHWAPAPGVASALISETVTAPWLSPVSLANLVTVNSPSGQVARQPPPQQLINGAELSAGLLKQVRKLDTDLRLEGSILSPPDNAYLSTAVAALESSAWRSASGARQASDVLARVTSYLAARERLVTIIDESRVTLGGQSGSVPVSITNKLGQPVTIQLKVQAPNGRITVLPYPKLVTIGAGQQRTIPVRVKAAAAGTTTLKLTLLTPGGSPLPGAESTLTVNATHFGTLALVIIGIALAVIAATAAVRALRRGAGPRGGADPAGAAPGGADDGPSEDMNSEDPASGHSGTDNVMRGPDAHNDIPEEPDEYASTPGGAERP
jgi:hypothetical protein